MNKNSLLLRYDKDLRLHINYPEARKEITSDVVRFIRPAPGMNFVGFTIANDPKLDQVIERELAYFAPTNQPFTWKVYDHDLLPGLKSKLELHNFMPDKDPADVMVLDVQKTPAHKIELANANICRITDQNGIKDVIHILDSVYGGQHDWLYERLGMQLAIPGYVSIYASYVNGKPASVAWTCFPRGHFATLFGGTTVAEYRERGLYTSLLHTRLNEVRERGYPFAIVETGPMSQPIVAKYGFQHLTTVYDYEWQAN